MVSCKICGYETDKTIQQHIKFKHNIPVSEYYDKYPGSSVYSDEYSEYLRKRINERDPSYKKKLSESTKRLYQNKEWVEKHNRALKRAQNTKKAKSNHRKGAIIYYQERPEEDSRAHKKRAVDSWKNKDIRKNREKALKEAHNRPEVIKKHSKATKEFLSDPENLEKRIIALKKAWKIPEKREKLEKIIKIGLEAAMSPKGRENFYKAQKDPELRKKRSLTAKRSLAKRLKSKKVYSNLNRFLEEQLNSIGLYPESEYPIGPYAVDFCFPKEKIVIEADGDWWHANPEFLKERNLKELHPIQKKMKRIDKAKNSYLRNKGWDLIRFWERDLYKKTDKCLKKIKEAFYAD